MKSKQLDLFTDRGYGGKRTGAGRPKNKNGKQAHVAREELSKHHPQHIIVKIKKGLPKLRQKKYFNIFKIAVKKARIKGLRIIHFSIQNTHLHLMIESSDKISLGKGMQSFTLSFVKQINGTLERTGAVLNDRYYVHQLKTPTEVKRALVYIFQNFAKHSKVKNRFDPYSTLLLFKDKVKLGLSLVNTRSIFPDMATRGSSKVELGGIVCEPQSFLLKAGWKRAPS